MADSGVGRQWTIGGVLAATVFVMAIGLFPRIALCLTLKESLGRAPMISVQNIAAARLLLANARRSNSDFECHVELRDILITNPWSGAVDRIPFTKLRISVEHPRVGRSDPDIYGFRTLLAVRARGPADETGAPQQCIVYSKLVLPERVSQKVWSKIDRLLDAFLMLGATVEQWRPPEDPSVFDEDASGRMSGSKLPQLCKARSYVRKGKPH